MGVDTTIIFTPVDRSWVGTPQFIRSVTAMLRITVFENFFIYRAVPGASDAEAFGYKEQKRLLEAHHTPIETAIALQRIDLGYSTSMDPGNSPFVANLLDEIVKFGSTQLAGTGIFEGFTFTNGTWETYEDDDEDGHPSGSGMCKLEIWMSGSPEKGTEEFLKGFLALETIVFLKTALEEFSSQRWTVLVHVW